MLAQFSKRAGMHPRAKPKSQYRAATAPTASVARPPLLAAGGPCAVPSVRPSASDVAGNLRKAAAGESHPSAAGSEGEYTAHGAHAAPGEVPHR